MCVDTFFVCDFFLNFLHGYEDSNAHLIMTLPNTGINYMHSGWIFIDLFTSIPWDWFAGGCEVCPWVGGSGLKRT